MRILLVAMEMNIGGAETHILELAIALKKRGNHVFVISAGGKLVEELEKNEIPHTIAPLKDKMPSHMIEAYRTIKRVITENDITVVHAHARIPGFICGLVCQKTHTRLVTTIHGIYKVNLLLRLLTNWGEKTLAVSEDIRTYAIREYRLNPQNVFLTMNGIDTEKFAKKNEKEELPDIRFAPDKVKIMHVSRLEKDSSEVARALLDIAEDLEQKIPNGVQIIIVGSGSAYQNLILESAGKGNIIFTGARTDVEKLLNHADIFVGVSRAALEAMATELPVILAGNSSYGQGYQGIFDENALEIAMNTNFTCRGFEKIDSKLLENDILRLIEEKNEKMGEYNRNIVVRNYSVSKMVEDALKIYK